MANLRLLLKVVLVPLAAAVAARPRGRRKKQSAYEPARCPAGGSRIQWLHLLYPAPRITKPTSESFHQIANFLSGPLGRGLSAVAILQLIELQPGVAVAIVHLHDGSAILETGQDQMRMDTH